MSGLLVIKITNTVQNIKKFAVMGGELTGNLHPCDKCNEFLVHNDTVGDCMKIILYDYDLARRSK